jgi:hypothetical protein
MGMFDWVWFSCRTRGCTGSVVIQSKAGECVLSDFSSEAVPEVIAADIEDETGCCDSCGEGYTVKRKWAPPPRTVEMRLI